MDNFLKTSWKTDFMSISTHTPISDMAYLGSPWRSYHRCKISLHVYEVPSGPQKTRLINAFKAGIINTTDILIFKHSYNAAPPLSTFALQEWIGTADNLVVLVRVRQGCSAYRTLQLHCEPLRETAVVEDVIARRYLRHIHTLHESIHLTLTQEINSRKQPDPVYS